jgi:hypothetical protein
MSEHDEYLWSGEGTAGDVNEVAALERSLASLRWRPRPLVLPAEIHAAEIIPLAEVREARVRGRSSWWAAAVAGLVAAAAVFALLLWPRTDSGVSEPVPAIDPAAPPSSPDLKDPFGSSDPPGFTAPITEERTPVAPTHSPDLKDPFAREVDAPRPEADPKRPRKHHSPDLKDPFGDTRDEPTPADAEPPTPGLSPDLKDPFGSRRR